MLGVRVILSQSRAIGDRRLFVLQCSISRPAEYFVISDELAGVTWPSLDSSNSITIFLSYLIASDGVVHGKPALRIHHKFSKSRVQLDA